MAHKDCPKNKSVIRDGELVTGCDVCLTPKLSKGNSAAERRRWQQAEYRKALVQPVDARNYIKAYGVDKARAEGFSDAAIRKYS